MEMKTIKCKYDVSSNSFKIEFDTENTLEINLDSDIVFTEFVEKLSLKITEKNRFTLSCEELTEPKQKIVIDVLKKIVNSYNGILQEYVVSTAAEAEKLGGLRLESWIGPALLTYWTENEIYDGFAKIYLRYKASKWKEVGDYFFNELDDIEEKLCDVFCIGACLLTYWT